MSGKELGNVLIAKTALLPRPIKHNSLQKPVPTCVYNAQTFN